MSRDYVVYDCLGFVGLWISLGVSGFVTHLSQALFSFHEQKHNCSYYNLFTMQEQ